MFVQFFLPKQLTYFLICFFYVTVAGTLGSSTSDLIEGTLCFNQAPSLLSSDSGISITHTHASETLAQ